MKSIHRISVVCFAILGFGALAVVGCRKEVAPPAPVPVEQLASALETAFAKAKPEVKQLASQVSAQVKAKDYTKAYFAIQELSSKAGLSKEQVSVTAGGLLTLNGLMQTAESQGDTKSAEALKFYRENK